MIVTEDIDINGKAFTKTYSDKEMMIEREGVTYIEALDATELGREYTETDIPIEEESTDVIEEKAKAYDILMGVEE